MLPIVFLGLVLVAGPACRNNAAAPDDTLPPLVTTPTTAPVTYDVPAVIDAAYAARVMQALDHVYGNAVRHLARTRVVDEEFLKHLVAIHNPRIFQLEQDLWVKTQARDFAGLRADPGDPVTRLDAVVRADAACIVIEGDRNFTPLFTTDDPTNHDRFVALTPLRPDRNPGSLNPTPWTINFAGQRRDGSLPTDACDPQ